MNAMRADETSAHQVGGSAGPAPVEITITTMRRRHLRSIVRIQAQHPHTGWSVGLWMAELRREHDRVYLVALVGRQVVGYAGVLLQDEDGHLTTIGVDNHWQEHRIATRLMVVLVGLARARGARNLTLEVRSSNSAAIKLYRRFGLAPAGVRKNYYADLNEDALIMWCHDIDAPAYAERLAAIDTRLRQQGVGATVLEGVQNQGVSHG